MNGVPKEEPTDPTLAIPDPNTAPELNDDPAWVANRTRFSLELEFVQALANPYYLHSLAQQGILNQPAFINYLEYLTYWKEREYARFLHYPHALHHLDLLQTAQFRAEIAKDEWREILNQKQFDHWRTWRDPTKQVYADADGNAVPGSSVPLSAPASASETQQQPDPTLAQASTQVFKSEDAST